MKRLLDTNAYVSLLQGDERVLALTRGAEQIVFSMVVVGANANFSFSGHIRFQAIVERPLGMRPLHKVRRNATRSLFSWAVSPIAKRDS